MADADPTTPPAREKTADGRTIVRLKVPVTFAGQQITELHFRELKAKDLREYPENSAQRTIGHLLDVAAKVCGQPPGVIDELTPQDLLQVQEILGLF